MTFRYKTWFFAGIIWPIISPFPFIFFGKGLAGNEGQGLGAFTRFAETPDYASFLIIGNLIWMFINVNLWTGGLSLRNNKVRGIFDTQMTMPVAKVSLVLGAVIFTFFPFLTGFLLMFSALTMRIRDSGTVVQVMRAVLSILCGMQFPLAVLPGFMQTVGKYIPLTQFVSVLRAIIIDGAALGDLGSSIRYILVTGFGTLVLGVCVFELVKTPVRKKGMVGGY